VNATARQAIPVLADVVTPAAIVAVEILRCLDGLAAFSYSQVCFFEHHTPGATATLRAWAAANGHDLVERAIPEYPGTIVAQVNVKNGPSVSVHRNEVTP